MKGDEEITMLEMAWSIAAICFAVFLLVWVMNDEHEQELKQKGEYCYYMDKEGKTMWRKCDK